jgi:hypothetical protein
MQASLLLSAFLPKESRSLLTYCLQFSSSPTILYYKRNRGKERVHRWVPLSCRMSKVLPIGRAYLFHELRHYSAVRVGGCMPIIWLNRFRRPAHDTLRIVKLLPRTHSARLQPRVYFGGLSMPSKPKTGHGNWYYVCNRVKSSNWA